MMARDSLGHRSRPGSLLRPSAPRPSDDAGSAARVRQARTALNPPLSRSRTVPVRPAHAATAGPAARRAAQPVTGNIMLDDMDKELERRGHRFCRYSDDVQEYVENQRADERVMESQSEYFSVHFG